MRRKLREKVGKEGRGKGGEGRRGGKEGERGEVCEMRVVSRKEQYIVR